MTDLGLRWTKSTAQVCSDTAESFNSFLSGTHSYLGCAMGVFVACITVWLCSWSLSNIFTKDFWYSLSIAPGSFLLLTTKQFYLFIFERGEGREKERERNIDVREKLRSVASHAPLLGTQPAETRPVPWPGTEPVTFCFSGWCPTNWAIPVKAAPGHFQM